MLFKNRLAAAAIAGCAIIGAHVGAQGTPPPPAPGAPQTPPAGGPPAPGGRGQGRGGGRGATFPAQQRPPGDPVLIERGKGLYTVTCSACHGMDLRGGVTGGPNLLRSAVVLNDQSGELIHPIVRGARADKGMPPILSISDDDIKAVAEYIHSVLSTARGQGAPPESDKPPPNALVGDASAGQKYFAAKCASCHSPSGDLQGIGTRLPEAKMLQNHWLTGGAGGGRGGGGRGRGGAPPKPIIVTVTLPAGEKVEGPLLRIDDFLVTLRQADGTVRSIRRNGDVPKIEIADPLQAHRALLAEYSDKDMHDVTAYLATLK